MSSTSANKDKFLSVELDEVFIGDPLPCSLFLYIDYRFLTYRPSGSEIDRMTYERLEFKKIRNLFIHLSDREVFAAWSAAKSAEQAPPPEAGEGSPVLKALDGLKDDMRRKTMDIFTTNHPVKAVAAGLETSKKLVDEMMKMPFAVKSLAHLQGYSRGTVDHSVNVSILAVYLGQQMGYSSAVILQHIGMGALLHDIGKPLVKIDDTDDKETIELKMVEHVKLGAEFINKEDKAPNEVKMIVAQHHEFYDGTGYPKQLRSNRIYDLARIVTIANEFDGLVADGQGTLVERQRAAITHMDQVMFKKFDPMKLEKAIKILKLGV